ncbi:MAG: hypothetical protein R2722_16320 [Tessaracoccus sp.]
MYRLHCSRANRPYLFIDTSEIVEKAWLLNIDGAGSWSTMANNAGLSLGVRETPQQVQGWLILRHLAPPRSPIRHPASSRQARHERTNRTRGHGRRSRQP